ncbi:MAG: xanthine dehydrogenase family protein molybdopterin-binding subunit, partial [Myxococcota bacterium]
MSGQPNGSGKDAMKDASWVGQDLPRREGRDKVTGRAIYIDDMPVDDVLYGATVRSTVARGKLGGLRFGEGLPWDEIVVVTAKDVPGANEVRLLQADQPLLADGVVNHVDEPVALIAHPDREVVQRALAAIEVEIEATPSVHSIADALAKAEVVWGEDNVFTEYNVSRGDVTAALAAGELVLEGEYTTGAQEQMYIEPQGMVARWDGDGVTIWGSLQCPYYVQTAVAPMFGVPEENIRVVQTVTGGGFGGKEEYPSIIAGHAALLSKVTGKTIKLIYDRIEDVTATTKRHTSRTTIRSAVDADGHLTALDIDFVIDGGAYVTLSPVVLSRGTIHAAGPYRCPNVAVRSRAVATNSPPHGAFRGFGAPQSIFALERHLDRVASALQMDPAEFRRINLLRRGDTTAVGQVIQEDIDLPGVLDTALNNAHYAERRAEAERFNAEGGPLRKGVGIATFYHGSGFTGAGEVHLASVADVEAKADGTLVVLAASTEIGQGTNTIFTQMAADAAGIDPARIEIANPDTGTVPNSGPTVASRTCMVVGGLIERAVADLLGKLYGADLLDAEYDDAAWVSACARYVEAHGSLRGTAKYKPPPGVTWDEANFRGDAYAHYAWAVYIASVTVDLRTAQTTVDDFVAVQEIGKTVHPGMAEGQIEGGVAQAVGWALYEDVVWRDGRVANPQMTNYIIPTSVDTPPIRVAFAEPFSD